MLKGKRILVGVTGGIAAYKIPFLVREFTKLGAEVKCILTPASSAFVTPLTLATVSKNPVFTELFNRETGEWANHVDLGLWADAFVIAPLTASSLAKLAIGHSDNLLLTTYLSARCPVFVAPAMDLDMYVHPTTAANLEQISKNNVHVIPAEEGELASGLSGQGRMAEPETIASFVSHFFSKKVLDYTSKRVLITAGPTYEAIDPVRFIGNHSTGKMGIALADELAYRGADVDLLLGPSHVVPKNVNVKVHRFKTAQDLLALTQQFWSSTDIGIFAAAVADYRPKKVALEKIKKSSDEMSITLVKNPDVLKWAGDNKTDKQLLVGFALETMNEIDHAKQKLFNKNLDLIVMNSLKNEGAGFGHDTNQVTLLDKHNKIVNLQLLSKSEVAKEIVDYVKEICS